MTRRSVRLALVAAIVVFSVGCKDGDGDPSAAPGEASGPSGKTEAPTSPDPRVEATDTASPDPGPTAATAPTPAASSLPTVVLPEPDAPDSLAVQRVVAAIPRSELEPPAGARAWWPGEAAEPLRLERPARAMAVDGSTLWTWDVTGLGARSIATGEPVPTDLPLGNEDRVVGMSPGAERVIFATPTGDARLTAPGEPMSIAIMEGVGQIERAWVDIGHEVLVVLSTDAEGRALHVQSGRDQDARWRFGVADDVVPAVAVSTDGSRVAFGLGPEITQRGARDGRLLTTTPLDADERVLSLAYDPTGRFLAVGGARRYMLSLAGELQATHSDKYDASTTGLVWLADGTLITLAASGLLTRSNWKLGVESSAVVPRNGHLLSIASDGVHGAIATRTGTLVPFLTDTLEPLTGNVGHVAPVDALLMQATEGENDWALASTSRAQTCFWTDGGPGDAPLCVRHAGAETRITRHGLIRLVDGAVEIIDPPATAAATSGEVPAAWVTRLPYPRPNAALGLSSDGTRVAVVDRHDARVIDLARGTFAADVFELPDGAAGTVRDVAVSDDGALVVARIGGQIYLLSDAGAGTLSGVRRAIPLPGARLLVQTDAGEVQIRPVAAAEVATETWFESRVSASPSMAGDLVLVEADRHVRAWASATGKEVWSRDDTRLLDARDGADGSAALTLWDREAHEVLKLTVATDGATSDARTLVSGVSDIRAATPTNGALVVANGRGQLLWFGR